MSDYRQQRCNICDEPINFGGRHAQWCEEVRKNAIGPLEHQVAIARSDSDLKSKMLQDVVFSLELVLDHIKKGDTEDLSTDLSDWLEGDAFDWYEHNYVSWAEKKAAIFKKLTSEEIEFLGLQAYLD